jgi:hypothetical protein
MSITHACFVFHYMNRRSCHNIVRYLMKQGDRKRGDRELNKFPDKTYKISDVSTKGQPLAREEALPKFRNALGFLVRDNLDITI